MKNNFTAAIFDMDGTLVDSMWMWKSIDIEYLASFGIPFPDDLQAEIGGMSLKETAVYFQNRFHIQKTVKEMQNEWNAMAMEYYTTKVFAKPGAIEYLKQLKEKGIKTGIATSNSRELLDAALNATGIGQYMDSIHTACEISRGKPAPDIYLLVAEELGEAPENCIVFEDIIPGIMAGHNAGMYVCSVDDESSRKDRDQIIAASDWHIHDFTELL